MKQKHLSERFGATMAAISMTACVTVTGLGYHTQVSAIEISDLPATDSISIKAEPQLTPCINEGDVIRIARTLYGEARGVSTTEEKAAVAWCILNRVDDPRWPDTVSGVITPAQFHGYSSDNPIEPELYNIALDVCIRYSEEKNGKTDVGRVLPKEYVFFHGDGKVNHFRIEYRGSPGYWDWSLPSPYTTEKG